MSDYVDDIMTTLDTRPRAGHMSDRCVSPTTPTRLTKGMKGWPHSSASSRISLDSPAIKDIHQQVDPDDPTSGKRYLSILKNRHTGEVGAAGVLKYDRKAGRLHEVDDDFEDLEF